MKDQFDPGTGEIEDAIAKVAVECHQREISVQQKYLDALGREVPNSTPMQPPIGYKRAPTIQEQMRAMIRQVSEEAHMAGAETEEEANDFDMDEEWEPTSKWEHPFDPDPALEMMLARQSSPPRPVEAPAPAAPAPSESQAKLDAGSK